MGRKTEKLTVRLSRDDVDSLTEVIRSEKIGSLSDAVRAAIQEFLASKGVKGEKILLRIPKNQLRKLKVLVSCGEVLTIGEAMREAIKNYAKEGLKEAISTGKLMRSVEEKRIEMEERETKIEEWIKK